MVANGDTLGDTSEELIARWRDHMNRPAIHIFITDGLESRLREEVSALVASGLAEDEAFMVAVKRVGDLDAASHQLA